ncbi:MAG: 6-phosphogluconolactonase [Pedobacter sp.]|nr:6-phosphogluconolactonase [Pedobacter sp.]MDQ8051653.1 6-phosphogluconolactonase [Pedobacter sp.]
MNLHIFNSLTELNEQLARYVVDVAKKAISDKGRFDFVLTGGNSPKELYKTLATTYKNEVDWSKVFFFIGDERNVPADHQDYNGLMAKTFLFNDLQVADDHVFLVNTALEPIEAAKDYKNKLDEHFGNVPLIFDLILLGMGDDAHTASIFPFTDLVDNNDVDVAAVWVQKLNTYRISFTAPLINQAKNIVFLAFGENKANALFHVVGNPEKDERMYPAQLIRPKNGNLDWFVDREAVKMLKVEG